MYWVSISSPLFLESMVLFDSKNKGRAYTILRDPIERAVSHFHHLKKIKDPRVDKMTIDSYASSSNPTLVENKWMVRYLSGKIEGELTSNHLEIAKNILQKKFVIGLHENMSNSMRRFEDYYGVVYKNSKAGCKSKGLKSTKKEDAFVSKECIKLRKETISLLEQQNELDLELLIFGKELYKQQGILFSMIPKSN